MLDVDLARLCAPFFRSPKFTYFRHRLKGTFAEPQLNYYRELQKTYRGFADMHYLQCAITVDRGAMRDFG